MSDSALFWAASVGNQLECIGNGKCDLMEVCCRKDSCLSESVHARGGRAIRIGMFPVADDEIDQHKFDDKPYDHLIVPTNDGLNVIV